jgi:phage terminase large subunit-like protein
VEFPQTIMHFADPTAEYERLVISGKMRHNGHPVLSWQAGNVQVWSDMNNNKRPVKARKNDYRTIDGIVAGMMALGRAMRSPVRTSVYETRGLAYI